MTQSTVEILPIVGDAAIEERDGDDDQQDSYRAIVIGEDATGIFGVRVEPGGDAGNFYGEIFGVVGKAKSAGRDAERRLEQRLPDIEEGHQAAEAIRRRRLRAEKRNCRRPGAWRRRVRPRRSRRGRQGRLRATQARMHCGPPIARMMKGMTMKGPMPTMNVMFREVASMRPRPRSSFSGSGICWARERKARIARKARGAVRKLRRTGITWWARESL